MSESRVSDLLIQHQDDVTAKFAPLLRTHPGKSQPKYTNPLQAGFAAYLIRHPPDPLTTTALFSTLPKRYTLYKPLLLLPANVFTTNPAWSTFYAFLSPDAKTQLYECLAATFKAQGVTHIAINAPIAAESLDSRGADNVRRSPTGLVPLLGDFGPRTVEGEPGKEDYEKALWVSAIQNGGVSQTWAPRWTMFSRGNIKEKARIMGEGNSFEGLDGLEGILGEELGDIAVVDMFVGIGYFAFSYLKSGVGLVWGWEINEWSVEGLRRGAERNGWRIESVSISERGEVGDEEGRKGDEALRGLVEKIDEEKVRGRIRCVIFRGDNKWSADIMARVKAISKKQDRRRWKRIRHLNLGLLPHARESWLDAVKMLNDEMGGWLHIHENVDIREIELKGDEIVQQIESLVKANRGVHWTTASCHVEQVKTYAPGVMHCVFDIRIMPAKQVVSKCSLNLYCCFKYFCGMLASTICIFSSLSVLSASSSI